MHYPKDIFPYEIKWLDKETNRKIVQLFKGERTGYVQVGDSKWHFPSSYVKAAPHLYNFHSRPDDIWVSTFPRSGTTLTQEMVWLIANDLDFETSKKKTLGERFPFLEFPILLHEDVKEELLQLNAGKPEKIEMIEKIAKPYYETLPLISVDKQRCIKTHLPFSLMPHSIMEQGSKVVYVARNPRDVAVSYYHLCRLFRTQDFQGNFDEFWDCFENNLVDWSPYWTHIKEGWAHRHNSNVLFLFYEDMSNNLQATIQKVAAFLGKTLTNEQVEQLADHLQIKNFKNNPAVNYEELKTIHLVRPQEQGFVRSGKSDEWSKEYTPELKERVLKWIEKNSKELGIHFPITF